MCTFILTMRLNIRLRHHADICRSTITCNDDHLTLTSRFQGKLKNFERTRYLLINSIEAEFYKGKSFLHLHHRVQFYNDGITKILSFKWFCHHGYSFFDIDSFFDIHSLILIVSLITLILSSPLNWFKSDNSLITYRFLTHLFQKNPYILVTSYFQMISYALLPNLPCPHLIFCLVSQAEFMIVPQLIC